MAQRCFEVKKIEFRLKNNDLLESDIDKKMIEIEEKFLSKAIGKFRTSSRSYAKRSDVYNKIEFEFNGEGGSPIGDTIKIFDGWPEVIEIEYTVNLRNMVILII